MSDLRAKSPWITHYNTGGCNGCDIEILAALGPKYDIERFGMLNRGNPKQSDILLVTGPVTLKCRDVLRRVWLEMPEPKVVVAMGACTHGGGVFRDMYHVENGVNGIIPVDVWIPGCTPRIEAIIDGLVEGVAIWKDKTKEKEYMVGHSEKLLEKIGVLND